jgi:micrococcal nuclease
MYVEVNTIAVPAGAAGAVATLVSVTDGDTLQVLVDGRTQPLRLIGMNAPEQDECLAEEATAYLTRLTENRTLSIIGDVTDRDQYDRLLRYVWAGDVFLNEALVRAGLAIARRYPPDLAYAELFDEAQADAQRTLRGMWAADACGPATPNAMAIVVVQHDAPGDDNQNLNGEWVTLRNDNSGPVDLSGWVLKDESASHRYTFPTGFVLLSGEAVTIYSGCGQDTPKNRYWCNQGSAIWNNDGDTAYLVDAEGNIVTYLTYSEQEPSTTVTATTLWRSTTTSAACHPSYIPCLLIVSDYDCIGGSGDGPYYTGRVQVVGPDDYGLDRDHDGIGCE